MRIAAVGDLHCTKDGHGSLRGLFGEASAAAEVIVLCGDLTDYGLPEEADVLSNEISAGATVPVVAVLGNHDHESGHAAEVVQRLTAVGVHILDGEGFEIGDVGFAGTKGFGGGFGTHSLGAWGEPAIKAFVQEAIEEELKLESGLARLRTPHRVVLLHYSPIVDTVIGEPEPIYPWLGTSRLEEPIDRYAVTAVVHGHAHHGAPEGATRGGVPVYNVSLPLLRARDVAQGFRVLGIGP